MWIACDFLAIACTVVSLYCHRKRSHYRTVFKDTQISGLINAPLLDSGSENATLLSHLFTPYHSFPHLFTPPHIFPIRSVFLNFIYPHRNSPLFDFVSALRHLLGTFRNFLQAQFPRGAMSNSNSPTPYLVAEAVTSPHGGVDRPDRDTIVNDLSGVPASSASKK